MRRWAISVSVVFCALVPALVSGQLSRGYAQVSGPVGDEFNNDVFAAPFVMRCGQLATPQTCPDQPQIGTWSLNNERPGYLRIWTQAGTLLGTTNNARNMALQRFDPSVDFTATTSMSFPGVPISVAQVGQMAGMIVYQDDDNFIVVGRLLPTSHGSAATAQLFVIQETAGVDTFNIVPEPNFSTFNPQIYFQVKKVGDVYTFFYSYDNLSFTPFSSVISLATSTPTFTPTPTGTAATPVTSTTPTATPQPQGYVADYASPRIGVFSWGGTDPSASANQLPADFDWFRIGNSQVPAATALPTSTSTAVTPTNTPVTPSATPTNTVVPVTSTVTPTPTPLPTDTPVPTPTPKPKPTSVPRHNTSSSLVRIRHVLVWYKYVRIGTYEHVELFASSRGRFGVWSHVVFSTGLHLDYYEETDGNGRWVKNFTVPADSIGAYGNQAIVTFQLWSGKKYSKSFITFFVVH